jgi:hypothetical protein
MKDEFAGACMALLALTKCIAFKKWLIKFYVINCLSHRSPMYSVIIPTPFAVYLLDVL